MLELLEYARNLIDAVPVGLVTYDLSGQCISANRAAARILGLTFEQLLSQNFRNIEGWTTSGLLETAEESISTGRGRRIGACLPTVGQRPTRLDCSFENFVSGGRRYLLYVVDDIQTRERRPRSGRGGDNG